MEERSRHPGEEFQSTLQLSTLDPKPFVLSHRLHLILFAKMAALEGPPPQPEEPPTLLKIMQWYKLFDSDTPPRLGMEIKKRLPYMTLAAFSAGMAMGASLGSKKAAFQFRAENAHRFPTTSIGWFQYHKTKNYTAIVGGVKEGVKMGSKLGAGALTFCLFEEGVDYVRNDRRDFLSTVIAGLSFSGIYSLLGTSPWGVLTISDKQNLTMCCFSSTRRLYCGPHDKIWFESESDIWLDAGRAGISQG